MPGAGLEPAQPCGQGILSPLRLPVSPPGRRHRRRLIYRTKGFPGRGPSATLGAAPHTREVPMATSPVLGLAAVAVLLSVLPSAAQQVTTSANRDRRLITAEEIHDASTSDTYQLVEKLRPEFLLRMSHAQTL